jgi:hypothetical protein
MLVCLDIMMYRGTSTSRGLAMPEVPSNHTLYLGTTSISVFALDLTTPSNCFILQKPETL